MRKPPYSRLLEQRLLNPRYQNQAFWLIIGNEAFDLGMSFADQWHRLFAVCPPEEDAQKYDWSIFRRAPAPVGLLRCGVIDETQLQTLIRCILLTGVDRVFDLFGDRSYIPPRSQVA